MSFRDKVDSLKNDILGKNYSLSVAFVDKKKSQEVNKKYRKKNKPTNVLSFPLRKDLGELLLCEMLIREEAKKIKKTYKEWLKILIIHGMLHLKGFEHGKKMEKLEEKYLSRCKSF